MDRRHPGASLLGCSLSNTVTVVTSRDHSRNLTLAEKDILQLSRLWFNSGTVLLLTHRRNNYDSVSLSSSVVTNL